MWGNEELWKETLTHKPLCSFTSSGGGLRKQQQKHPEKQMGNLQ